MISHRVAAWFYLFFSLTHFFSYSLYYTCSLDSTFHLWFSLGFRSGDWSGHVGVLNLWSSINTFIDLPVWHGALSYWEIQSARLRNIVRAEGSKFCSRMTLYMAQIKIYPIPALLKHLQFISNPSSNLTVGAKHCGLSACPRVKVIRKTKNGLIRDDLTPVFYSPILMVFSTFSMMNRYFCVQLNLRYFIIYTFFVK